MALSAEVVVLNLLEFDNEVGSDMACSLMALFLEDQLSHFRVARLHLNLLVALFRLD